jgi:hypothetical protein
MAAIENTPTEPSGAMNRRRLLAVTGGLVGTVAVGGLAGTAHAEESRSSASSGSSSPSATSSTNSRSQPAAATAARTATPTAPPPPSVKPSTIRDIDGPLYVRARGTSTDELEPQPDPHGADPWVDVSFYSNPIFINR